MTIYSNVDIHSCCVLNKTTLKWFLIWLVYNCNVLQFNFKKTFWNLILMIENSIRSTWRSVFYKSVSRHENVVLSQKYDPFIHLCSKYA